MSHLDPEVLALLALGEQVGGEEDRAHLAECADCAADLSAMRHTVTVARSTVDEPELEQPAPRVWSAIAADLGLGPDVADDPLGDRTTPPAEDAGRAETVPPTSAGPASPARHRARGARRRRSSVVWVLAASFAIVAVVGGGLWAALARNAPTAIAEAVLDAFPDHAQAEGTAQVDEARDGARTLRVTLSGEETSDDYREVWLIRNDGNALISLGVLDGDSGEFPIPSGVDLAEYDLVDISVEPVDGDPAHSGDSIVRGQLRFDAGTA